MNFDEIDNLSPEEIEKMYFDLVDSGDNVYIAECCCYGNRMRWGDFDKNSCKNWCRSQGASCRGWEYYYDGLYWGSYCYQGC